MRIITLEKNEFDNLAQNHKYKSYFQTSNYAEFEQNNGFNVHYLGFLDDNEDLVGGAMCLYKKLFWNYSYAYIPRGLLIDYDNPYLVNKITTRLKKLLRKQRFIFIKIDPPVIASERDFDGKIIYSNYNLNQIMNMLKNNNYQHKGFNLYYETRLPRWNNFIKLNGDYNSVYNNFDKQIQENIKKAHHNAITIEDDKSGDVNLFYELAKKSYGRFGKRYFENLVKSFGMDNIDIHYAFLDSSKFVSNSNKFYNQEEERNRNLANIISGNETYKYNVQKVISDKMVSDKNLHQFKKNIVASTEFLKKYPNGKILATSFVIKNKDGAECLVLYEDKDFANYNAFSLLINEMCKKYANMGLKYLNLGPATGNFDKKSIHYKRISDKRGYNTTIIEYIGEFDLVVNPLMYKVYLKKLKKAQKNKKK